MNKKGQGLRILIALFIGITILAVFVALLPLIASLVDIGTSSQNGLNCAGSADYGVYNLTAGEKSAVGCLGLKLYIPLFVLIVLIGVIGYILYGDNRQQAVTTYG